MFIKAGFLFLLQISTAYAGTTTTYCGNLKNFNRGHITNFDNAPALTCNDLAWMDTAYSAVWALSPYAASRPVLMFGTRWRPDNGEYLPVSDTISLGYHPQDPKQVIATGTILAHEVGHKIFQEHLDRKTDLFRRFARHRRALALFSEDVIVPLFRILEEKPGCQNTEGSCGKKFEELQTFWRDKSPEPAVIKFVTENKAEIDKVSALESYYGELFADLVSAVLVNDSEIEVTAVAGLDFTNRACRSFTFDAPKDFYNSDPHCALSSLRKKLWAKLVQPRLEDKKAVLDELATKLIEDLNFQLAVVTAGNTVTIDNIVSSLSTRLGL